MDSLFSTSCLISEVSAKKLVKILFLLMQVFFRMFYFFCNGRPVRIKFIKNKRKDKKKGRCQQQTEFPDEIISYKWLHVSLCCLMLFQMLSISSRLILARSFPFFNACCSIWVNRWMNFLLVSSSAFSASTCKNRA